MPCMSLLGVMLFLPSHLQAFALLGCFSNAPYEGHYSNFMLFDGPFGIIISKLQGNSTLNFKDPAAATQL